MAGSEYYDNGFERRSLDDATPEEWNAAARADIERRKLTGSRTQTWEERLNAVIGTDEDIQYKYNEAELIKQFKEYVDATYGQHYSRDKFQATEFIIDGGHGTGFCIGNVLKYAQRYGKKGGPADHRKDLMKVLHYALIQLYIHDQENT